MGNICNCNEKNTNAQSMFAYQTLNKDPRLAELQTHLKILDAKLNSNNNSIDDFKYLLIETKKEPIPHKDILAMINKIEEAFEEAKQFLQQVAKIRGEVRMLIEQVDSRLSQSIQHTPGNSAGSTKDQSNHSSSDSSGAENKQLIDGIYKKISEMSKLLRKGEEDAQVQMLNWENFVIQHEKMKKWREEIEESFKSISDKLQNVEKKSQEIKDLLKYFKQVSQILGACQDELHFALANASLRHDESNSELGGLACLYETFEEEEREDDIEQIADIKEKITAFSQKTQNSTKDLEKQKAKLVLLRQKRDELNEYDIYELDSFHKKLQDFLNTQEITLYKLNTMISELKVKYESGALLDICEQLMTSKTEIQLCLRRIDITESYCDQILNGQNRATHAQQNGGGSFVMVQRGAIALKKFKEQMETNLSKVERIQQVEINLKDLDQIEAFLMQLAIIQKESIEANRTVQEEYVLIIKLDILSGTLGWKVSVQDLYNGKQSELNKIKKSLTEIFSNVNDQYQVMSEILTSNSYTGIIETGDNKEQCERLMKKTKILLDKQKQVQEMITDMEINLDRWLSDNEMATLNIIEGVDIEDQDASIQEFINLAMQLAHLQAYNDKMEMLVNRNFRIVKRTEISLLDKNTHQIKDNLSQQLTNTRQMAYKVEQKIQKIKQVMNIKQQQQLFGSGQSQSLTYEQDTVPEWGYYEKSKQIYQIKQSLDSYQGSFQQSDDQLNLLSKQIINQLSGQGLAYQNLFSDPESVDTLKDKIIVLERKFNNQMKQVKELNGELHQIFVYLQKQSKLYGGQENFPFLRTLSAGDDAFITQSFKSSYVNGSSNKLQLNSTLGEDENSSYIAINNVMMDEIDQAMVKCIEQQSCFKNLQIDKIKKGCYKLEKKEYMFKLLPGNNLAIRMFAGYIFTDCLVHFDEELMLLVKS